MVALLSAALMAFATVTSVTAAPSSNVFDVISSNSTLSTLTSLLKTTGLDTALAGAGPFTVFAPTDAAFARFPDYKIAFYTASANSDILTAVLKYHVASGSLNSSSFFPNEGILTLQGSHVFIQYIDGTTTLGMASATCDKNVHFVSTQVMASNGIVHIIDTVLNPPAVLLPDQLFWVEQRGLSRVGFSGYDCRAKGETVISTGEEKPVGIAVDSNTKQVFWSNDQNAHPGDSWLTSATFDGQDKKEFVTGAYDPQGMDTDTVNRRLYYTEHQGNRVLSVDYDGTNTNVEWTGRTTEDFPADVAVDAASKLVFFTVQSVPTELNGTLHVQNYDGSGHRILISGLIANYGLCLDTHAKHIYYIQGGHGGSVSCMAYGSQNCNTKDGHDGIILSGLQYPYMCAVDNLWAPYGGPTKVIFSEPNVPGSVYAVNSNGTDLQLIASDLNAPMGMKLGSRSFFA